MSNSESPPPKTYRRRAPVPVGKCGAARAVDLLADKWMLLIVREAFFGVFRYDDIREDIGIPRSVLTERLKRLVAMGVLEKRPYREEGARQRQGYVLTAKGRDLGVTLIALMQWADAHIDDHSPAMDITRRETGRALRVGFLEDGEGEVPLHEVVLTPKG